MREEIAAGMRNALERGESLEQAVQTFINAGYNPFEVRAVAQVVSGYGSSSSITHPDQFQESHPQNGSSQRNSPNPTVANFPQPSSSRPLKKGGKGILVAGIIISSLIVLGALGYLVYMLVK